MELVDILTPPSFNKSGLTKPANRAIKDGDWLGVFHLWIITTEPEPGLIYQIRSPNSKVEPDKLDVSVGGHYHAGETRRDGLREAKEELGIAFDFKALKYLGRKIWFGHDEKNNLRRTVVDVHFVEDNRPLSAYHPAPSEVFGLVQCSLEQIIQVFTVNHTFTTQGISSDHRKQINVKVDKTSFPYNWDQYHLKIPLLAKRYLSGDKPIIY